MTIKELSSSEIIAQLAAFSRTIDEIDNELAKDYIGEYEPTEREETLYKRREKWLGLHDEFENELLSRGYYFDGNDQEYKLADSAS